jgi:hypothetical protein
MNTKLFKSVSQVILSLSSEERTFLQQELNSISESPINIPINILAEANNLEQSLQGVTLENLHREISIGSVAYLSRETKMYSRLSEASFSKVWDNSDDAAYDNI